MHPPFCGFGHKRRCSLKQVLIMELKRVVVTGIGTLTPLGNNLEDYWTALINGVSGADNITLFDASKFKTRFACEIKGFDPTQFMDRKEARKMDRFAQLALVASDLAVATQVSPKKM